MLPERQDVGRALSTEEETRLLLECRRSRSRILLPFVVMALETGARFNTIRTLQWGNIDLANRCLKFGKDKTAAGTGRTVPLNKRAVEVLTFWAQEFPKRSPEHYVFPAERVGAAGDGFDAKVYDTDTDEPSWYQLRRGGRRQNAGRGVSARVVQRESSLTDRRRRTGTECESCRFEKLTNFRKASLAFASTIPRHTAVSRMIGARVPLPLIAKIVGWSAGTMAKMASRYGHFGLDELRGAVESISRGAEFEGPSPRFSPQSRPRAHSDSVN